MRTSRDEYRNGKLWNGYDYEKQEWVFEGKKDERTLEELFAALNSEQAARCPDCFATNGMHARASCTE